MDKRTLIALARMAGVLFVTPRFFRSPRPAPVAGDTLAATATTPTAGQPSTITPSPVTTAPQQPSVAAATTAPSQPTTAAPPPPRATVTLKAPGSELELVTPGAAPERIRVPAYRNLRPGSRDTVVIAEEGGRAP